MVSRVPAALPSGKETQTGEEASTTNALLLTLCKIMLHAHFVAFVFTNSAFTSDMPTTTPPTDGHSKKTTHLHPLLLIHPLATAARQSVIARTVWSTASCTQTERRSKRCSNSRSDSSKSSIAQPGANPALACICCICCCCSMPRRNKHRPEPCRGRRSY